MDHSQILAKIIKPEFQQRFEDWHKFARAPDLLGLECIEEIYASKGTKYLKVRLPHEKQLYETQKSLMKHKSPNTLEEAEENFRRQQITTSYKFYHAGYSVAKEAPSNVFEFTSLSKMTISFIDRWIELKDSKKYQEPVLSCLRSLSSKLVVSDPNSTEMRRSYNWKNDWELAKPIRMDKAGEDLFAFKPNYAAIKRQQQKNQAHRRKMEEMSQSDFIKQLKIFKDFKIN